MDLPVLGLLLILAAAVLYGIARSNRRVLRYAQATEITAVKDLVALHAAVSGQVGSGLFAQRAGLQGTLECGQPLVSELGSTPCAAFRYRVERRWEEDYEQRSPGAPPVRRTRPGTDVVAGNERRVPFWISDASGRILVDPDGAKLYMEKSVDRFEPGASAGVVRFRDFELPAAGRRSLPNRRTLGYHFKEEILPLGRPVYVLGTATDREGNLVMARSLESRDPFLVSLRPRDHIVRAARQTSVLAQYAFVACAALGLLLLVAGLIYGR